jgi:hypothetical protein
MDHSEGAVQGDQIGRLFYIWATFLIFWATFEPAEYIFFKVLGIKFAPTLQAQGIYFNYGHKITI